MTERDERGYITKLDLEDPTSYEMVYGRPSWFGTAVCQHAGCGLLMPGVWNVICYACMRPFCYDHTKNYRQLWYCFRCAEQVE